MPGSKGLALDLFSGTGSVGAQLKANGFDVVSLDCQPSAKADITIDILVWDYKKDYKPGDFALIAAGVPCTEYSVARTTGPPRDLEKADRLVAKTLEIIAFFRPKRWWLENPRWGLLKSRKIMENIPFVDVDYCQFSGWGYQKPTRIWCCEQIAQLKKVVCDKRTCLNIDSAVGGTGRHRERLGGNSMGYTAKQKGRTPLPWLIIS